jgi:hypothetical protein
MDPFISFTEVLAGMQASMPNRYAALVSTGDANLAAVLQTLSAAAAQAKAKQVAEQQQQ